MNAQGSFNPSASVTSGGAASKEESDAKLKALEDREAALLQKESDQSAELDKKAKELQERQDALDQEEKKRAASKMDFDSKLKALEDREAKLTQKDKDQSAELDKNWPDLPLLRRGAVLCCRGGRAWLGCAGVDGHRCHSRCLRCRRLQCMSCH